MREFDVSRQAIASLCEGILGGCDENPVSFMARTRWAEWNSFTPGQRATLSGLRWRGATGMAAMRLTYDAVHEDEQPLPGMVINGRGKICGVGPEINTMGEEPLLRVFGRTIRELCATPSSELPDNAMSTTVTPEHYDALRLELEWGRSEYTDLVQRHANEDF